MRRLLPLLFAITFGLTLVATAQQESNSAASNPLVRQLQSKGVFTAQEAAAINQAPTREEQQRRMSQLLFSKGVISEDEYNEDIAYASRAEADSATLVPVAAHISAGDPAPDPASAAPQQAPAIIPAVAPLRVLQTDPSKPGGIVPDVKLGSGAKLKFYGFIKSTASYDSSDANNVDFVLPGLGAAANGTAPTDIPVGLDSGIAAIPGVGSGDSGPNGSPQFRLKARATRAGANFEWPDIAGSNNAISGRVEVDFEGNYSRATNRNVSSVRTNMLSLRLAWARIDHRFSDHTSAFALFGQDWTPFGSSTLPNILETTGLGLYFGTLYERQPQFRVGLYHNFGGSRNFTVGVEPTIVMPSFGNLPADLGIQLGVSERQGADSARPELNGRLVLQFQLDTAKGVAPAQIIFSGMHGNRRELVTRTAINNAFCGAALCPAGTRDALLTAFPSGAAVNSDRYGATGEIQLPTRFVTLVAKYYNGEDLRWYFGGQLFSVFNDNRAGFLAAPGGAACTAVGGNCPTAFSIDASTPNVIFGFDAKGVAHTVTQNPVRSVGGFAQIAFPLSRIFNANPEGRNAGWTLAFTYGTDQAKARDVRFMSPAGQRDRSDMGVGTLFYKLNQLVTFGYESSIYWTRSTCATSGIAANSFSGFSCTGTLFRGLPARAWHDWRNEFGPIFNF